MYFLIFVIIIFPYVILILKNVLKIPLHALLVANLILIFSKFYNSDNHKTPFRSQLEWVVVVAMLVYYLASMIRVVRYFMLLWLYYGFVIFTTAIFIPIFMFRPFNPKNLAFIIKFWKYTFPMFGLDVKVEGRENLNVEEPCVFISNHQSSLDMIPLVQIMPFRTTALAKKELFYTGFFGVAAWLSGVIFVDRSNHSSAINTMKHASEIMMKKKVNVWIFPEGTRSMKSSMLPFKKGAFHLAIEAQVPIVAVVFSPYNKFLDHEAHIFNSGEIVATCLPHFPTKGLTSSDVDSLIEKVRGQMMESYKNKAVN